MLDAGGTTSCFLNQPLCWWYCSVHPYDRGTTSLYAGGTDTADQSSADRMNEFSNFKIHRRI